MNRWKMLFEQDIQSEEELLTDTETEPKIVSEKEVPVSYTEIIEKVANWIKTDGYVQQGLTIKELSKYFIRTVPIFPLISRLRINDIPRMDNRSPVGVCEKHTEGASGNQYTEAG